jgi:hypothetical protein
VNSQKSVGASSACEREWLKFDLYFRQEGGIKPG